MPVGHEVLQGDPSNLPRHPEPRSFHRPPPSNSEIIYALFPSLILQHICLQKAHSFKLVLMFIPYQHVGTINILRPSG